MAIQDLPVRKSGMESINQSLTLLQIATKSQRNFLILVKIIACKLHQNIFTYHRCINKIVMHLFILQKYFQQWKVM